MIKQVPFNALQVSQPRRSDSVQGPWQEGGRAGGREGAAGGGPASPEAAGAVTNCTRRGEFSTGPRDGTVLRHSEKRPGDEAPVPSDPAGQHITLRRGEDTLNSVLENAPRGPSIPSLRARSQQHTHKIMVLSKNTTVYRGVARGAVSDK